MHTEPNTADMAGYFSKGFGPIFVTLVLLTCIGALIFFLHQNVVSRSAETLAFAEMYAGADSLGITLSEKLVYLKGKRVRMTGFMAPPLKPTLSFFVLTDIPMSICPFCSSDADWPSDIVVVKLAEPVTAIPFDRPIWVEGTLEVGSEMDEETGFVSLVRIRADAVGKEDE
ncbi:MAG: hypothetical protein LUC93_02985 [Planctomycetaceae bacterium]|nr:hypothetical protein [Planctomycetaceae bacterium]